MQTSQNQPSDYRPRFAKKKQGKAQGSKASKAVQYRPKNSCERKDSLTNEESTYSSSPSDKSNNSSVERKQEQKVQVLATSFEDQHVSNKDSSSESGMFEGGSGSDNDEIMTTPQDKKFKSYVLMNSDDKELKTNTSLCDEDQTNDETNTIDNTSEQNSESPKTMAFDELSQMQSRATSRRASIDSRDLAQETLRIGEQFKPHNINVNSVSFKPMSSVATPFKPGAATSVPAFVPTAKADNKENEQSSGLTAGLQGLKALDNDFTPSTPYVHKFRTEMCKNWELYGKCKYGDEVSPRILFFSKWYYDQI